MSEKTTEYLDRVDFYEIHESEYLDASPEAITDAVMNYDMRSDWVADCFLSLRELPERFRIWFKKETGPVKFNSFGFQNFTLLFRSNEEVSLGLIGRFWRPDMGLLEISGSREFELYNDNKAAKLVLRFHVVERSNGKRMLRTETFVYCPSRLTKLLFTPYWLVIRIASGWIRTRTLKLIKLSLSSPEGYKQSISATTPGRSEKEKSR